MALLSDYLALVPPEHADKPKFMALVALLVQPYADLQAFYASLSAAFDLDQAIGVQLDAVGLWAGITRRVATPITGVYFAWDTPGLGWDQGVWQGPFDPTNGIISLDDETFRLLIRAKIGADHWDGTLEGSVAILAQLFPDGATHFYIDDHQDMTMTIGVSGVSPNALTIALLNGGYLGLKPEGVRVNYVVTTVSGTPVFGFDVENQFISGWDVGSWGA